jgi:hypothetical protein
LKIHFSDGDGNTIFEEHCYVALGWNTLNILIQDPSPLLAGMIKGQGYATTGDPSDQYACRVEWDGRIVNCFRYFSMDVNLTDRTLEVVGGFTART